MARAITGRITLNLVAGILVTVLTVFSAIIWMAQKQNDQAAKATTTMVVGGLQAMEKRVQGIANDYSWWEDAYDAYTRHDDEWMWSNVGSSVEETQIADLMAIVSPAGKVDYVWATSDLSVPAADIVTPEIIEGIRKLTDGMPVENLAARPSFITVGENTFLIAVSRIAPVSHLDDVETQKLPFFVAGFLLSPERLANLGKSFLIDDLRLARESGDGLNSFAEFPVITDIVGKSIGHLVWTSPTPGYAVLRGVFIPIFIALALFCVVALTTALRARKMAIALTESEREAVIAARTDSMTGLTNRTGFTELLESEHYVAACQNGALAIVYLDINGFKTVNDTIGHHGGDDLVKALAIRITSVLPPSAVLARIGGDEFAIALIAEDIRSVAADAATAAVRSLDRPFTICGFEFHVTTSGGYTVADHGNVDPAELVRRADLAMYQAKNGAERDALAYHPSMETGAVEKKQIEVGLRRAIENESELHVVYQPVVRAADLTIIGFEALLRWTSPEYGAVSPALFVPVAEETGLIHDIGRFVINQVCRDLHRWPGYRMAVNISPVQLRDPDFANDLLATVKRHGLTPDCFELELTEGILVNNPTIAKRKLAMLKEFGFTLSLDDFGTGFSSIGYLRQFPFDILKVDRSFVRDVGLNATANALLQSLVSLGDALDLAVIAEGIENEEQLKLLRLIQCEFVQGFLISRPVAADDIDALLAAGGAAPAVPRVGAGAGGLPERKVAASN